MQRNVKITVSLTVDEIREAVDEFLRKKELASNEHTAGMTFKDDNGKEIILSKVDVTIEMEDLPF